MKNFAILKRDCPFYSLFEGGHVPIINILAPDRGRMGGGAPEEFYRVDVAKLTGDQFDQIAVTVAMQCGGSPEEVAADMKARGFIPLRASHVASVSTDTRVFL